MRSGGHRIPRARRGLSRARNDTTDHCVRSIAVPSLSEVIECDRIIVRTHPSAVLGAYLDAILAGANEFDASDIAKVIERRPRPTYEERMAVFSPTGRPEPSREPFTIHRSET
jgi:hypothetical protein